MVSYRLSSDARLDLQRIYRRASLRSERLRRIDTSRRCSTAFKKSPITATATRLLKKSERDIHAVFATVDTIYYRIVDDVAEIMRILDRQDMETQF